MASGRPERGGAADILRKVAETRKTWRWAFPSELRLVAAQAMQKIDPDWVRQFVPKSGLTDPELAIEVLDVDPTSSALRRPYPGIELTYNHPFGEWRCITFGLEAAVNYLRIDFNDNSANSANATTVTTLYQLPGTTPPAAPFQGTFNGSPGGYSLLGATPISTSTAVIPGATLLAQDKFNGDLWGFRLGPYADFPLTDNLSLHLSAGLALGLLYDQASWQESLTIPGVGTASGNGSGDDFRLLWGGYISLAASYQFDEHWGIEGGVQFEDLGKYKHSFGGREADLDLSRSIFVQVGLNYSF